MSNETIDLTGLYLEGEVVDRPFAAGVDLGKIPDGKHSHDTDLPFCLMQRYLDEILNMSLLSV